MKDSGQDNPHVEKQTQANIENILCPADPYHVLKEIHDIVALMFPDFNFSTIQTVFDDIFNLFEGRYPGYKRCNTRFHDLKHTMDCVLAFIRIIHGAFVKGFDISPKLTSLGLISALMHDTGYIQTVDDTLGTGAKYTQIHVQRSIDFMDQYFKAKGFSRKDHSLCAKILKCTGLDVHIDKIEFDNKEHHLVGMVLGTADLIGQMSDRSYLEKLYHLFNEFEEAGIPGYESKLDLLKKTFHFYTYTQKRFIEELDNVVQFSAIHFKHRWNLEKDLYQSAIKNNLSYLKHLLDHHENEYENFLRREDHSNRWQNLRADEVFPSK